MPVVPTTLSYPSGGQIEARSQDFVLFSHYNYNTRKAAATAISAAPPAAGDIKLYMPESTPQIDNTQAWGEVNFPGPLGAAQRDLVISAGRATGADIGGVIDGLKDTIGNAGSNAGGIAKQLAVDVAAQALGVSGNQMTSLSKGNIFNPNTELTYDGPGLRTFSMSFNFVPKSQREAEEVQRIILEFKKFSSPEETGGGLFNLPHIWSVTYFSGGSVNKMNRFKPAALIAVTVAANPTSPMHATFSDGMPIQTSIGLSFKEVELITRQDHVKVGGQGY